MSRCTRLLMYSAFDNYLKVEDDMFTQINGSTYHIITIQLYKDQEKLPLGYSYSDREAFGSTVFTDDGHPSK
ncbi:hypothetical protein [Alkalinema pantanalense]|uniref:hypothetical protein n=1 Tax=Alkalinema pantanalense TaxID=1620705 RepID=UPI003D6F06C5